jgi:hypothetical protein
MEKENGMTVEKANSRGNHQADMIGSTGFQLLVQEASSFELTQRSRSDGNLSLSKVIHWPPPIPQHQNELASICIEKTIFFGELRNTEAVLLPECTTEDAMGRSTHDAYVPILTSPWLCPHGYVPSHQPPPLSP